MALDLTTDQLIDLVGYAIGWGAGWFLLWRPRPLPAAAGSRRAVAVIIPARNEEHALANLLPELVAGARPDDEIVVVDDHSDDRTAVVAADLGARVIEPPPPPPGWLGKPNACWSGSRATAAPILLFVDADVLPPRDLIDRIAAAVDRHPDRIVSVQPWHRTGSATEQLSALCNIAALMGPGTFSLIGARRRHERAAPTAFGPVLAMNRDVYDAAGGHAHQRVRSMHTEDIGLAQTVGGAVLYTGRPDIAFRMYPGGMRDLIRGWTRSLATGARYTPWWAALGVAAWIWSLTAGWTVTGWFYLASALQVWILARRAGSFSLFTAIAYPLALAVFLLVFIRSAVAVVLRLDVTWKQRRVAAR